MTPRGPRPRARIDWEAARQRLAVHPLTPGAEAEAAERILRERAVRLAAVTEARPAAASTVEVLTFERAGRRYAVESRYVVEVGSCGKLTRIPGAQQSLLGVTNLRGDVLPVFDLSLVWDAENPSQPLAPQLVVLGAESPDLGILADTIDQVGQLPASRLSGTSRVGLLRHSEYLRGITDQGCVLIDGDAVLRDRAVFVATRASGSQPERDRN